MPHWLRPVKFGLKLLLKEKKLFRMDICISFSEESRTDFPKRVES